MSRGPGRMQRALFVLVRRHGKPMTFREMCISFMQANGENSPDTKLIKPTFQRSMRRALKKMVDDGSLMALGDGGPGDPKRYWLDPLMVAMTGSREEYESAFAALKADPGAEGACFKFMQRMTSDQAV
jgi:hypothetical protein